MATTVAQPGTALRKIAKTYAAEAGMPVDQYLEKLRKLNPDYAKTNENTVRLGKGVGVQPKEGDAPAGDQPADPNRLGLLIKLSPVCAPAPYNTSRSFINA